MSQPVSILDRIRSVCITVSTEAATVLQAELRAPVSTVRTPHTNWDLRKIALGKLHLRALKMVELMVRQAKVEVAEHPQE